jgi:hypothetical protein
LEASVVAPVDLREVIIQDVRANPPPRRERRDEIPYIEKW